MKTFFTLTLIILSTGCHTTKTGRALNKTYDQISKEFINPVFHKGDNTEKGETE